MYSSRIVNIKISYFHAPSLILFLHLLTCPINFDGSAWLPQVSLSVHLPRRVVRTPNASFELRRYTSLKNTHPAWGRGVLDGFQTPCATVWKTSGVRNPSIASLPSVTHGTARAVGVGIGLSDDRQSPEYPVQTRSSLSVSDSLSFHCVISIVSSKTFFTLCCCGVLMLFHFIQYLSYMAVPSSGVFWFPQLVLWQMLLR